jgi:transcriptional regulator with XRE-family HTH domain
MSVEAVGIYLNKLTDLRGLKVKAVAEKAGVKPGYVSRLISHDVKEPSASVLRALTQAVEGSWEDVGILLDPRADRLLAELLAEIWYKRSQGNNELEALRARLLESVDDLLNDEAKLRRELQK